MPDDRPTLPTDGRWRTGRVVVVSALIVQALLLGLAVYAWRGMPPPVPARSAAVETLTPEDLVFPDTDIGPEAGKRLAPINVRSAAQGTPEQVRAGASLFAQHCAACHGGRGQGDGPAGVSLNPRPRDLSRSAGWKQGTRVSDIFRALALGLKGTQMAAFDYLSHEQRFALVHFVRSLASGRAADTDASLEALDREFSLSQGAKGPNRIAVGKALEKAVSEAPPGLAAEKAAFGQYPIGFSLFRTMVRAERLNEVDLWLSSETGWRNDVDRLRTLATAGVPANGFFPRVARLTADQWMELHRYLLARYRAKTAAR